MVDGCGEFGEEAVEFRFVYCPFVHVFAPVAQETSVNPAVYGGDADSRPLRGLLGCDNCGHWFPLVMVAIDDMIEKVSPAWLLTGEGDPFPSAKDNKEAEQ